MSFIIWQEFLWKGGGTLRYKRSAVRRRWPLRLWARLAAAAGIAAFVCFNAYVEREIQPTMMQIAEYEARRLTTQAVHQAVEAVSYTHLDVYKRQFPAPRRSSR